MSHRRNTGIWAVDIANKYPEAFVIGVDLAKIQLFNRPRNCDFYTPRDFEENKKYNGELILAITARDKWISTEDELAGRSSRTPMQQENYWIRTKEELDVMLEGRDAQLKKIYRDILELHQVVKPEENYSVEMLRQKVLQLRKKMLVLLR